MAQIIFFLTIFFHVSVFANILDQSAEQITSMWEQTGKPILLLGESSHRDLTSIEVLKRIVASNWRTIQFVALETNSSEQEIVNTYLETGLSLPQKFSGTSLRDPSLLTFFRGLNEHRKGFGLAPIRIIALDSSGAGYNTYAEWFADRGRSMASRLQHDIQAGHQGVIFTGAGLAARDTYALPKILQLLMRVNADVTPIANDERLRQNSVSVFIQGKHEFVERALLVASGLRPFLRIRSTVGIKPGSLASIDNETFRRAAERAGFKETTAMNLTSNFDYWIQIENESPIPPLTCEDALSSVSPKN